MGWSGPVRSNRMPARLRFPRRPTSRPPASMSPSCRVHCSSPTFVLFTYRASSSTAAVAQAGGDQEGADRRPLGERDRGGPYLGQGGDERAGIQLAQVSPAEQRSARGDHLVGLVPSVHERRELLGQPLLPGAQLRPLGDVRLQRLGLLAGQ